jgi:transposase InsO family protein
MTLIEDCRNNKLTLISLHKLTHEIASDQGVILEGTLTGSCERAAVNRSQVYEQVAQMKAFLGTVALPGPGRPSQPVVITTILDKSGDQLLVQVLRFRLSHPGAVVVNDEGRTTYSAGFTRFILDLHDERDGSTELFCSQVEVPCQTLRGWLLKDQEHPYEEHRLRPPAVVFDRASHDARKIVEDYSTWEGSFREFLKYEAARMNLAPAAIRRVLIILGQLPLRSGKGPRYRGSTTRCRPGSILVTDGKTVTVVFTGSGEIRQYNWQGIIDQATSCHTAVVVTDTESAASVKEAFDGSCTFLGRAPQALLHDNKPIHDERELREHIEKTTIMIPATPARGENKAGMEGEFGKFEQTVGVLVFDDRSEEQFIKSAVREALRTYTAGMNHSGRVEFDGKSRERVLRDTCSDPEKDRRFIEELHADHTQEKRVDLLSTKAVSRALLDEGFKRCELTDLDATGSIRSWLAGRFTPEAIRQGLAIFSTEWGKGRLRSETAHRYLVKVIMSRREELDLCRQEELLREYAEVERSVWLQGLEAEHQTVVAECIGGSPEKDLAFQLGERAVFGGLILQRAFWENKLKILMEKQRERFTAVCSHVRRLSDSTMENRFALISKLVAWEYQLAH